MQSLPNRERLRPLIQYWGAISTEQAASFLKTFYDIKDAETVVENLCDAHQLTHMQGRKSVVSLSDYPGIVFNQGKERAVWVFLEYCKLILHQSGKFPTVITMNDHLGVNFTYNNEYYCMIYVAPTDLTYYNILKTVFDEHATFIFVTDDKQCAEKVKRVNAKDKIWYVQKVDGKWDIVQYKGKVTEDS